MGRFLDEPTHKGKFLDEATVATASPSKKAGIKDFAVGGFTRFGAEPGSEDILPATAQMAAGRYGLQATGAASLGELARQGIKAIRGDRSGFKSPIPVATSGMVGLPKTVPSVGKEAATTATVEGVFRGAGKAIRPLLEKGANRMMQSALKASVPVREKYPKLGIDALEEGIYGTRGQMLKKSEAIAKKAESELQKLLSGRPEKVNLKNVISELGEMKRRALNIGDDATLARLDKFEKFLLSKGEMIGASEANQLKRDFYSQVSDPAFLKKTGDLAESPEMYRRAAQGLRKEIVGGIPEAGKLDKTASTAIKAQKALKSEEARSLGRVAVPFLETAGLATGAASGYGIPAAAFLIARRLANTPLVKSQTARALFEASKSKAPGFVSRVGASEFGRRVFGG